MLGAFLLHDAFLAEMVEPLLCHVRSQAKEDAQDASGDIAVLLEILLDFANSFSSEYFVDWLE